jgi:hypothetical protein
MIIRFLILALLWPTLSFSTDSDDSVGYEYFWSDTSSDPPEDDEPDELDFEADMMAFIMNHFFDGTTLNLRGFLKDNPNAERIIKLASGRGDIQILDLSQNNLQTIPDAHFPLLRKIILSHNQLQEIPALVLAATALNEVDISYNQLTEVHQALAMLPFLQQLDLSHNKINQFPACVLSMNNLRGLSLASNTLLPILEEIDEYPTKLEYLNLSNTDLTTLPSWLGLLPLEALELENCPLTSLPASLVRLGRTLQKINHSQPPLDQESQCVLSLLRQGAWNNSRVQPGIFVSGLPEPLQIPAGVKRKLDFMAQAQPNAKITSAAANAARLREWHDCISALMEFGEEHEAQNAQTMLLQLGFDLESKDAREHLEMLQGVIAALRESLNG